MSILIKGMKMPDSCGNCPLISSNWIHTWCVAVEDDGELPYDFYKHPHVRQEWCPLEEVKEEKDGKTEQSTVRDMPES